MNDDRVISIADVLVFGGNAFGSKIGEPGYSDRIDLNQDGRISIADTLGVGGYFGFSCQPI